ncbi:MAG: hypothetical protein ACLUI3_02270 [Christensenellales bacterium]
MSAKRRRYAARASRLGMYALLCAAVVVQMLFGAGFAQVAGRRLSSPWSASA